LHWFVRETLTVERLIFANISEHVTLNCPFIGFPAKHFYHGTWTYHQLIMRCTRRSRKSWIHSLYSNPMKSLDDFSFNDWLMEKCSIPTSMRSQGIFMTETRTPTHIPIIFVSIGMAQMRLKTVLWNIRRELLPGMVHPGLAQGPPNSRYANYLKSGHAGSYICTYIYVYLSPSLYMYRFTYMIEERHQ